MGHTEGGPKADILPYGLQDYSLSYNNQLSLHPLCGGDLLF